MAITDSSSLQTTSPSLIGRAASGDSVAWQRLIQLYGPLVYSWGRRSGLQPQDAADVTQETFSAVATRLVTFDATRAGATFRGWLWTITRNKAADLIRDRRLQPGARGGSTNLALLNAVTYDAIHERLYEESNPPSELVSDKKEVIHRAIAIIRSSFEPTTWQAFWRTAIDGCSPDEVARELSLSRWAVYKARSRVLHRLRTELDGLEDIA